MRNHRKKFVKTRSTFAIVVDGKTEVWYFQMLKRNERKLNVNIEPKLPSKKSLSQQYKMVLSLAKVYDKVFWMVDYDVVKKETIESRGGKESAEEFFIRCRNEILKDYKNVVIIVNNPCLEFWFLLHYETTSKLYRNSNEAEKKLRKYLKDYQKKQSYFIKEGNDIYLKLKPRLKTAIENAENAGLFDEKNLERGISEMSLFFKDKEISSNLF